MAKEKKNSWFSKKEKKVIQQEDKTSSKSQDKPYKVWGLSYCGHCMNQAKIIGGHVKGYNLVSDDKGKIAVNEVWGEPDVVLKKTKRSLETIKTICSTNKGNKKVCNDAQILMADKIKELDFITKEKNLFDSARNKFELDYLDDLSLVDVASQVDAKYKVEGVPAIIDSQCKEKETKKCKRTGMLDPVHVILHDAIAKQDEVTIDKVKNFLNDQRKDYIQQLKDAGKLKEAEQTEQYYNSNTVDKEIKNWWNGGD